MARTLAYPALWTPVMMRLHCIYRVALLERMGSWNTSVSLTGVDAFGKSITVNHRGSKRDEGAA